jgi:hypothetical protein
LLQLTKRQKPRFALTVLPQARMPPPVAAGKTARINTETIQKVRSSHCLESLVQLMLLLSYPCRLAQYLDENQMLIFAINENIEAGRSSHAQQ